MILQTERLLLREMTQEDFPALCCILQDEQTMYAYEGAFSDSEAQVWLDRQLERYRQLGFGLWAVILKQTGEMIGQCGLTMQPWKGQELLEIGYLFNRSYCTAAMPPKRRRRAGSTPLKPLGQMRFAPSFGTPTPPLSRLPCETGCIRQIGWSSTTAEWICRTTAMWCSTHLFWRNNKSIKKDSPCRSFDRKGCLFLGSYKGERAVSPKAARDASPPSKRRIRIDCRHLLY